MKLSALLLLSGSLVSACSLGEGEAIFQPKAHRAGMLEQPCS